MHMHIKFWFVIWFPLAADCFLLIVPKFSQQFSITDIGTYLYTEKNI